MADSFLTSFMVNLKPLLSPDGNLLRGIEGQLKILEDDLIFVDDFLRNSEAERNENDVVKEVVDQIRDAVIEAEDVLETYMVKLFNHRIKKSLMVKLSGSVDHTKVLHVVSKKIRSIKKPINEIYDNINKYGIVNIADSGTEDTQAAAKEQRSRNMEDLDDIVGFNHGSTISLLQVEDEVVGLVHDTTTLVKHLTQVDTLGRDVISILGIGGLGKTTLAKRLYSHMDVKSQFPYRAWVYVSQDQFKSKDLLLNILRCWMPVTELEMYKMSEQELKEKLEKFLQDKKYIVVMDDLWKSRDWNKAIEVLPNSSNGNGNGSRILITSRLKEVPEGIDDRSSPHYLSFLGKDESWKLFCKKVFGGKKCRPELETLGRQLAESCKGLPISILVLGGLLAKKEESYISWSKLIGNVNLNYDEKTRCLDILALGYNHLPRHLKSCFLYFGVFPVGFVISARQLIKLWLAEGFIPKTPNKRVVDVAEEYLEQLIDRSLIQVISRRTDGGVKTCCIHDLLRDLSIFESSREKFLEVHSEANPSSAAIKVRRLSIQGNISESISSYPSDPSSVRSLLLCGEGNDFDTKHWRWIYKHLKLIRVLCLEKVNLNSIPNDLEKLIFLRYLRIWSKKVLKIPAFPSSICKLQHLETIDIKGRIQECLPKQILWMKRLRHLNLSGGMSFPETAGDATPTSDLQVLSYLLVRKTSDLNILRKFPKLRKLHLRYTKPDIKNDSEVAKAMLESLETLKLLRSLKIVDFPNYNIHSDLFPSTLVKITFVNSDFGPSQFEILGKLENLQFLKLKGEFSTALSCAKGHFCNLQVFQIIDMKIMTWELRKGAMVNLQRLVVCQCSQLRKLPDELCNLNALRLVEVSSMSEDFTRTLSVLKSKNGCKLLIDSGPL